MSGNLDRRFSDPEAEPTPRSEALHVLERAERLRRLTERLRSPDGLDHGTLAQVEELSGDEQ